MKGSARRVLETWRTTQVLGATPNLRVEGSLLAILRARGLGISEGFLTGQAHWPYQSMMIPNEQKRHVRWGFAHPASSRRSTLGMNGYGGYIALLIPALSRHHRGLNRQCLCNDPATLIVRACG